MKYAKNLLWPLLLILFQISCNQKQKLHVFLCLGQSNMAGRAEIMAGDTSVLKNVFLLNSKDEWESARNPLNKYSTIRKSIKMQKLGPAWSFAKTLCDEKPNMKIGLIVNAKGGSSINEWQKGSKFYDDAVNRASIAQKTGEIKAILWHQGEADMNNYAGYTNKFKKMIEGIRSDLSLPDLPIIVGQIGSWKKENENMNEIIWGLGKSVHNVKCVSTKGLKHLGDSLHFDNESQKIIGERMCTKYLELML